jgi:hypothetical protein
VAPICTNCQGTDFVWANELKTSTSVTGATSTLSLRPRGEIPIGTRICRSCGHAELFLRDPSILHRPHQWKPGEFVPIASPKPAVPAPTQHESHHSGHHEPAPVAAAPAPPPTPVWEPPAAPPEPMPAPTPPAPEPDAPSPEPNPIELAAVSAHPPAEAHPVPPLTEAESAPAAKPKTTKKRTTTKKA